MAKKSAKSKGYRKSVEKKPYLSKRDIVILCVLLVVVAVGAILLFSYDDGALKTKGSKIVDAGENWLIVNGAASGGKRYYKVGEVGELEGYAREIEPSLSDDNLHSFRFTPEDETSAVRSVSLSASAATAKRMSEYYHNLVSSLEPSDISTTEDGRCTYFTYKSEYHLDEDDAEAADADTEVETDAEVADAEAKSAADTEAADDAEAAADAEAADDAEAEPAADAATDAESEDEAEAEPNRFEQAISAYADAGNDRCVAVSVSCAVDSPDDYLSDEALLAIVTQVLDTVQLDSQK